MMHEREASTKYKRGTSVGMKNVNGKRWKLDLDVANRKLEIGRKYLVQVSADKAAKVRTIPGVVVDAAAFKTEGVAKAWVCFARGRAENNVSLLKRLALKSKKALGKNEAATAFKSLSLTRY